MADNFFFFYYAMFQKTVNGRLVEVITNTKAPPFHWKVMTLRIEVEEVNFDPTRFFLGEYLPLINLYREKKIGNINTIWTTIVEKFKEKGIPLDAVQISNRFKTPCRSYNNFKKNQNKTGRGSFTFPYEK